jgi:hypothetical protein
VNAHQAEKNKSLVHNIMFYVVELAAEYTTHQVFYSRAGWSQDSGRLDGMMFIERCLRSERRTLDPAAADFFVMPIHGGRHTMRDKAFDMARMSQGIVGQRLTLSMLQDGVPVVWPPAVDDNGGNAYPGIVALLRREREDVHERGRHIFLTAHGLHVGHTWMGTKGSFRPGQDVVIPTEEYAQRYTGSRACDFFSGQRSTKLLFKGTVLPEPRLGNVRLIMSETLAPLVTNRSDFVLVDTSNEAKVSDALFSLHLHGRAGGFAQRDYIGMLDGSLPVFGLSNTSFVYEEIYPPKSYGLVVEQTQLQFLPEILDHLSP